MKTLLPAALVALMSVSSFVGCAAPEDAATDTAIGEQNAVVSREIRASRSPEHIAFSSLWAVRTIAHESLSLRIYETGGGDPALNGNYLWLGAFGAHGFGGGMFDLGLNVASLDEAVIEGVDEIRLRGTHDTVTADGDIQTGLPFEARVKLKGGQTLEGYGVEPTVKVTFNGTTHDVDATDEEAHQFLASTFEMTSEAAGESDRIVRLYQTAGGDPAMNGVGAFITVMSYPDIQTFDLGINVATISRLRWVRGDEFQIEGFEDTMNAQGDIVPVPFTYTLTVSFDDTGAPRDVIKLTKQPNRG